MAHGKQHLPAVLRNSPSTPDAYLRKTRTPKRRKTSRYSNIGTSPSKNVGTGDIAKMLTLGIGLRR